MYLSNPELSNPEFFSNSDIFDPNCFSLHKYIPQYNLGSGNLTPKLKESAEVLDIPEFSKTDLGLDDYIVNQSNIGSVIDLRYGALQLLLVCGLVFAATNEKIEKILAPYLGIYRNISNESRNKTETPKISLKVINLKTLRNLYNAEYWLYQVIQPKLRPRIPLTLTYKILALHKFFRRRLKFHTIIKIPEIYQYFDNVYSKIFLTVFGYAFLDILVSNTLKLCNNISNHLFYSFLTQLKYYFLKLTLMSIPEPIPNIFHLGIKWFLGLLTHFEISNSLAINVIGFVTSSILSICRAGANTLWLRMKLSDLKDICYGTLANFYHGLRPIIGAFGVDVMKQSRQRCVSFANFLALIVIQTRYTIMIISALCNLSAYFNTVPFFDYGGVRPKNYWSATTGLYGVLLSTVSYVTICKSLRMVLNYLDISYCIFNGSNWLRYGLWASGEYGHEIIAASIILNLTGLSGMRYFKITNRLRSLLKINGHSSHYEEMAMLGRILSIIAIEIWHDFNLVGMNFEIRPLRLASGSKILRKNNLEDKDGTVRIGHFLKICQTNILRHWGKTSKDWYLQTTAIIMNRYLTFYLATESTQPADVGPTYKFSQQPPIYSLKFLYTIMKPFAYVCYYTTTPEKYVGSIKPPKIRILEYFRAITCKYYETCAALPFFNFNTLIELRFWNYFKFWLFSLLVG